jgi:hypothetical protein
MNGSVQRLISLLDEVLENLSKYQDRHESFQTQIRGASDLTKEQLLKLCHSFSEELGAMFSHLSKHLKMVRELANSERTQQKSEEPEPIAPDDLARHFRDVIDAIHQEAQAPKAGIGAAIIKSMEVELRGLILVQDKQTRFVMPTLRQPVDADQLSTIRMAFGMIPVVRSGEFESEPPPE